MTPDRAPIPSPAWQAGITAALLRQGRWPGAFSLGLSLIAVAGLVPALAAGRLSWAAPLALSLGVGLLALWLTIRVAFDAELFALLARDGDLAGFDHAMGDLGLMPREKAGRPLGARIRGARRLLKALAISLAVQLALLLFGALLILLTTAP